MSLRLGVSAGGQDVSLDDETRSRHVHMIGASGTGKSKLLESLVRQDIEQNRGLCLIDPHGTLADPIVEWCAALGYNDFRDITVIEPAATEWCAGFNPLRADGHTEITTRVDAMVAACAEVWGGENINEAPLLATCLQLVFYALAVRKLTLLEAIDLTSSSDPGAIKRTLTEGLPDQVYASYWQDLSRLSRREFEERFSSTRRRLLRFLGAPVVRRIVGQSAHVLDARRIMDRSEILIVNLKSGGAFSEENARLLGTLLASELFLVSKTRDPATAQRRPFTLYIDECYDFVTHDVERMLDQTRKFGLHVVLAHQRLGQLRDRGDAVYNGVMAGGQTKVVFGGLSDEDAQVMALEVFRSSFNPERPKHLLDKPIIVDEELVWLEAEGEAASETSAATTARSSGRGSSTGHASGAFDGVSESTGSIFNNDDEVLRGSMGAGASSGVTRSHGVSESRSESESEARSRSTGRSQSRSRHQVLKPVRQVLPTAVYSLEEELHLATVRLRELPSQSAILKARSRPPVEFRPATIRPALSWPELVASFNNAMRHASPYLTPAPEADAEIQRRQDSLRNAAPTAPKGDDERFWTE